MSSQAIGALVNLSLPIECLGLFLAWSDLRKWKWLKELEVFIDKLAVLRENKFGGFVLGLPGLELVAVVVMLIGFYFFGANFNLSNALIVYCFAALILVALPFACHALNLFGKENAIGSIGVFLACVGVFIEVVLKYV